MRGEMVAALTCGRVIVIVTLTDGEYVVVAKTGMGHEAVVLRTLDRMQAVREAAEYFVARTAEHLTAAAAKL